jgi:hypothetical protein
VNLTCLIGTIEGEETEREREDERKKERKKVFD